MRCNKFITTHQNSSSDAPKPTKRRSRRKTHRKRERERKQNERNERKEITKPAESILRLVHERCRILHGFVSNPETSLHKNKIEAIRTEHPLRYFACIKTLLTTTYAQHCNHQRTQELYSAWELNIVLKKADHKSTSNNQYNASPTRSAYAIGY